MAEKVTIGNCELWHGDCREVLPLLPAFDLVLTDPPYGIGADAANFQNGTSKRDDLYCTEWDAQRPASWIFGLMREMAKECVIWGGNYFTDLLPPSIRWLVWDKGQQDFSLADCEFAWSSEQKAARIFSVPRSEVWREDKQHPTQKPVRLMLWCLDMHPKAATVCDPFMGSGTTGVACAMLGKAFTGIERERKYFDIACERIERAQAQGQLLQPEQKPAAVQEALL